MVDVIFGVVAKLRDAPPSRSRGIALAMSSASRAALVIWVILPFNAVIFVAKHLDAPLSRLLNLALAIFVAVAKLLVEALLDGFVGVVDVILGGVAKLLVVQLGCIALAISSASPAPQIIWVILPFMAVIFACGCRIDEVFVAVAELFVLPHSRRLRIR